ncbi:MULTISPECIES: serine/threonine-protein kinase [unclassified Rhodosalinus]|uniref:serine/threonine-protein kinase n=1 Tax=unclassified Rhodosalinus TaxID=2630183 RepID=UPI0035242BD3
MTEQTEDIAVDPAEEFGDALRPGTELCGGQYTIDSYLNSGGFGITYLARDSLGRKVVIKECFPGAMCCRKSDNVRLRSRSYQSDFDKIIELFEREARALSALEHPNIVGVHQIFKDNGTAYMALDFIEGRDLLQIMEEERDLLTPRTIKRLLIQLLDAVAYIHERGILHRDISPDNILLDPDNSPVLIDFGAARESASRASRILSKVHTVKDGYSPQEYYLAGSYQGRSSDLYALAATFYHLINGRPPPNSHLRLAATAENRLDPYVPLGNGTKGYDAYFLTALNQCLSVFPKDRLDSAEEWREMVDTERREAMLRAQAQKDKDMEHKISMLVTQSLQAIEEDDRTAPSAAEAAAREAVAARAPGEPLTVPVGSRMSDFPSRIRPRRDPVSFEDLYPEAEARPAASRGPAAAPPAAAPAPRLLPRLLSGAARFLWRRPRTRPGNYREAQRQR